MLAAYNIMLLSQRKEDVTGEALDQGRVQICLQLKACSVAYVLHMKEMFCFYIEFVLCAAFTLLINAQLWFL
jgi:hypothetical protein